MVEKRRSSNINKTRKLTLAMLDQDKFETAIKEAVSLMNLNDDSKLTDADELEWEQLNLQALENLQRLLAEIIKATLSSITPYKKPLMHL